MTELIARLDDWSDRLSPILVKEIRQMVRGREFNYSFGLSLVAGFFVAFYGLSFAVTSIGTSGAWVFSLLMVCLGLLGLIVVPLGAFSALRTERADQTLDLITQTSLTPRRIVIGKLMTQWVKLIMLFAGLSPFIAISFLLGGIDLLTILVSLTVLFMWSMWVCSACLFLSSASQSRALSVLVFIGMAIAFVSIMVGFAPFVFSIVGVMGGPSISLTELKWVLLVSTAVCFTSMTNLVLLAENRLSLPIEDRSTALRIGFFVQFLLGCACVTLPRVFAAPGFTSTDMVVGLGTIGGIHIAVTAIFAVTEDLVLSRRVFNRVKKSLKKPWAIFRPGGGRGAAWILAQMVILLALGWMVASPEEFHWLLGICSYICFFSGVPTVVVRRVVRKPVRTAYLRAGILLFFPVLAVSADILQYFVAPSRVFDGTFTFYHILNPIRVLGSNWTVLESQGWQWGLWIMGIAGLIAYLELYRMGRREDKHAATIN